MKVTQAYGVKDPDYALGYHAGIDLGGTSMNGAAIYAAGPGIVRSAGWHSQYGNNVYIKHTDDTETHYSHLQECRVYDGQQVNENTIIGYQGNTGWSTGSHLDFELWKNNSRVDPAYVAEHGIQIINVEGDDYMILLNGSKYLKREAWGRMKAEWGNDALVGWNTLKPADNVRYKDPYIVHAYPQHVENILIERGDFYFCELIAGTINGSKERRWLWIEKEAFQ